MNVSLRRTIAVVVLHNANMGRWTGDSDVNANVMREYLHNRSQINFADLLPATTKLCTTCTLSWHTTNTVCLSANRHLEDFYKESRNDVSLTGRILTRLHERRLIKCHWVQLRPLNILKWSWSRTISIKRCKEMSTALGDNSREPVYVFFCHIITITLISAPQCQNVKQ